VFDVLAAAVATQLSGKGAGKLVIPGIARLTIRRTKAVKGEHIELVVDTSRLHFFDIETGLAVHDGEG